MADIKKINGMYVKDETARNSIEELANGKVDKVEGKSLVLDTEIERLATLSNYDDTELRNLINSKGESSFSGSYNDLTDKPEIPSIEGLATEEFVNEKINEAQLNGGSNIDLSNYVTKDFIGNKQIIYLTQSEYDVLSEDEKNNDSIVYTITDAELSYNDLTDKPEIPSIEGLATEDFVQQQIASIEHPQYDDSELRGMIEAIEIPEIPSLEGYATEEFVTTKIAEAQLSGSGNGIDLANYATKEYVMEQLGGKKIIYITYAEYELLSEEEKNDETVIYNITDSTDSFVSKDEYNQALVRILTLENTVSALQTKISSLETANTAMQTTIAEIQTTLNELTSASVLTVNVPSE